MTPNILKSNVGGGAGYTPTTQPIQNPESNSNNNNSNSSNTDSILPSTTNRMDGDHTAKNLEQGANSAMKGGTDMAEGVHESVNQTVSWKEDGQYL
jgi:hypothetical protein